MSRTSFNFTMDVLRTRISHPPDRTTFGKSIWSHILRDQIDVTEAEFWACVQDKVKPDRGEPKVPAEALPADLVHLLLTHGLSEAEIAKMSKEDAIALLSIMLTWGNGGALGGTRTPAF